MQTMSSDGKNPLRTPIPTTPLGDYVVAIENATGKALAAWPGTVYKRYNQNRVTQYRISSVTCTQVAIDRAERLHRTLDSLTNSPIVE